MMEKESLLSGWFVDLRHALALLTRLPLPAVGATAEGVQARAGRLYPVIGVLIGAVIGFSYEFLASLNTPRLAAATLALAIGCLLTGALHEDGLADVADGFGGGRTRERKLEIMRDSRIGTYGVLALLVAFVARAAALAALPIHGALAILIVVHALARAPLPLLSLWLPLARNDGLAASVGETSPPTALVALVLGAAAAFVLLPFQSAMVAIVVAGAAAAAVGVLAWRQIGGRTGDVLGAAEQLAEIAVLTALVSRLA